MMKSIIKGILTAIAVLPLGVLYLISDIICFFVYHVLRYRRKIVRDNLTKSFPSKTIREIKKIEKEFYHYLGDQIMETVKLFHISTREMGRRVKVCNPEIVNKSLESGRSAVLLMGHYCNWEWVQEISRYFIPEAFMASIYHPLSSKTWDELFIDLRSRWGAHIVPMQKAPRILLNKNNTPWVCGFIADQWPHKHEENNITEFLNHKTYFIYGPEEMGNKVGADFFYLEMNRLRRGYYRINFHKLIPEDTGISFPHTRLFWEEFEKTIERAPAFWLWSHRRWK